MRFPAGITSMPATIQGFELLMLQVGVTVPRFPGLVIPAPSVLVTSGTVPAERFQRAVDPAPGVAVAEPPVVSTASAAKISPVLCVSGTPTDAEVPVPEFDLIGPS